jgi:hypothetical protein
MPLDAGTVGESAIDRRVGELSGLLGPASVVLQTDRDIGAALKTAREGLGLAIDDIAQATRIRPAHVASLEAMNLDALPARPFVIGYVRAYARALGLETEAVVARFRADVPGPDDHLRAPWGLQGHAGRRRFGWIAAAVTALVLAIVAWNVVRHVKTAPRHVVAGAPARLTASRPLTAPAQLGAPLPAPPEADAPPTYETPGLAGSSVVPPTDPPGAPFVAAGPIYGAPSGPGVVLQARKPTSLIVRGPDGAVYFARQLAAGEAWRAPGAADLVADVGNPGSIEAFRAGVSIGDLSQAKTSLSSLEGGTSADKGPGA